MKCKVLRNKDTKEFIDVLEGGIMGTISTPHLLPMSVSMEIFTKYVNMTAPDNTINFDELEIVEFDVFEAGEIGADIRNKLSPPKNLVALLEDYFDTMDTGKQIKLLKFIQDSMAETKVSVEYLSKLL